MESIRQVIEALRQEPSTSEQGTAFEKPMVRYFELDPLLSQQYDQVWRWIDWPGRDGKTDMGIDLVARDRGTGEYTAVYGQLHDSAYRRQTYAADLRKMLPRIPTPSTARPGASPR